MLIACMAIASCGKAPANIEPQKKKAAQETPEVVEPLDHIIVAYVVYWESVMPDPQYVTHINYAFAHVKKTFDGVEIKTPARLKKFVALKKDYPDLKVLLSVGGWGAGNFSEMAADPALRAKCLADLAKKVEDYELDGIDWDWEYPTSNSAGISSSPDDTKNFTLLLKELRELLGPDKLITMASSSSAKYVDFKSCIQYMDFVNLMCYDMGRPPQHHSALYPSSMTYRSVEESVALHKQAGVPYSKIVVGVPFYGKWPKEIREDSQDYNEINFNDTRYTRKWDDKAKVPYMVDAGGNFVFSYEDPESIKLKGEYIVKKNLLGGMYWNYEADDNKTWILAKTFHDAILPEN